METLLSGLPTILVCVVVALIAHKYVMQHRFSAELRRIVAQNEAAYETAAETKAAATRTAAVIETCMAVKSGVSPDTILAGIGVVAVTETDRPGRIQ